MKNKFGFILINPQLGENIGACARSLKNFGFSKLRIVSPKQTWPNNKAKATSVGAYDIVKKANGTEEVVGTYFNYVPREGDKIIRNGEELKDVKYLQKKHIKLNIGDIVERHLKDGDIVLLNRQPTLHKGSMIAQKIIIRDCKTIRMNLAITKTFNADFDGDEMNIHVPATPEGEAELRYLSSVKNVLISAQSSKSNIAVVQDSLVGNYLMTLPEKKLTKEWFFQICMSGDGPKFEPEYQVPPPDTVSKEAVT